MLMLYIMAGLPFSGKSMLAKKIATYTGNAYIGFDEVWEEEQSHMNIKLNKIEEWKWILQIVHNKIKQQLSKGTSVVYDDTNAKKEHRIALSKIAKEFSADFKVVFMDTTIETIKERQNKNLITQERHNVASINFENLLVQFETPLLDENVIKFQEIDDIAEWLEIEIM